MSFKLSTIFILVSILLSCGISNGQNQEFSKNSIKVGIGLGASSAMRTDGLGLVYSVGYQREIWKDRLRINPNFSIGHYSSKFILDARDQYYNSINLEANIYYDLIKVKAFSVVLGCGGLINNSRGLLGTGGDPEAFTTPPTSKYFSSLHYGGFVGGGFRVNPAAKRIAINIMLINLHFGNDYFAEFHAKIELDFKF